MGRRRPGMPPGGKRATSAPVLIHFSKSLLDAPGGPECRVRIDDADAGVFGPRWVGYRLTIRGFKLPLSAAEAMDGTAAGVDAWPCVDLGVIVIAADFTRVTHRALPFALERTKAEGQQTQLRLLGAEAAWRDRQ